MMLHHTDIMALLARAASRLEKEGKPNDQLVALLREVEAISDQAEAFDAQIKKVLEVGRAALGTPDEK